MKKTLTFTISRDNLLNANAMTSLHHYTKGKMSKNLKEIGYTVGFQNLPQELAKLVEERKLLIDAYENNKTIKSKLTKKHKKNHPTATAKELKEMVEKDFANMGLIMEDPATIKIPALFNFFKITVLVSAPSSRRIDPQNYTPTTKHIIDGLTWAGYWDDDDWKHLDEISFKYGGVNNTKTDYIFTLIIEEIDEKEELEGE